MLLEIENLKYKYPDGNEALKGVSFKINHGEKIALIGANGSGKSTLLLEIAGALKVQSGKINLNGTTGLILQDSDDQILMPSVIEDVAFNLVANGMKINEAHERAEKILRELEIEHLKNRAPHKLSGGEKKIVSLAGILISEPDLILLDEPTASLDLRARRRVINILREMDKAILLATHDLDMTLEICTRAIILNHGIISASGDLQKIFADKNLLEDNGLELPYKI